MTLSLVSRIAICLSVTSCERIGTDACTSQQCASDPAIEKPASKDQLLLQFGHKTRLKSHAPSLSACEEFCAIDWDNRNDGRHCAPGDMSHLCGGCDYCAETPTEPTPAPTEPTPAPTVTDCCSKCSSFCSPSSGNCYWTKLQDYYVSCDDAEQERKHIEVNNRQLLVDGLPLHIKGICWGPTPKGKKNEPDYTGSVVQDADLMQEAGINAVRTYGVLADTSVLDALWERGIWVVPTVYEYGGADPSVVVDRVNAVKDHPAILMWSIGNEWNYNGIYAGLSNSDSVKKLNDAARLIKENDDKHPVATIYGELPDADTFYGMPDVDLWGINSYRGISHGNLFEEYESRGFWKPMFMGEYGADAFNADVKREDGEAQARATRQLTEEIVEETSALGGAVLGGFLFEFNDEWWKDGAGDWSVHDKGGIAPGGGPYPDMTFNEEWWGIVDIDRNPRKAYTAYKEIANEFAALPLNHALQDSAVAE